MSRPEQRTLSVMALCWTCGHENPDDARFCMQCGASLEAEQPTGREERKVVTVFFADLVGFTGRAEQLDPEDVRAMLSPYYGRLRSEIERFGGTVEKFIGDAVMAVFGAPVAHEDDPERAVRAGLAVRDAIQELNEENPALDLHVRIAVNTGEAVVALGARVAEGEGMVAGDVVNTAARLQTAAPVDGILVGETTYRATERAIEYVESDPVQAKGKSDPVRVWEAKNARARYGVDVQQGGGAPLVGRQAEVDLLTDALARARSERTSQLLTLVGVPGIGKSRLVWELWQIVDNDPEYFVHWRQGRSLPYGEGVAFWALAEMVKAQASILETDSADVAETKLRDAVADLISEEAAAGWVESHLRPLVGLAQEGEGSLDRRTEAFAAWRRFFEALAERNPLVLVFEDLHWADDNLLDFVDHLVEWATHTPLLVIATARPELLERRPDWGGGKSNAATVSISPLSEEDIARLLGSLLAQPVMPAELQVPLLARAGGNPLYAEEYARMVSERGLGAIEDVPLPENVQGIVAARLDGLSAEEKALIQDAAVLGKVFWSGALAAMTDAQRWTVEEQLHGLERKEFVRRERLSSVASETEYAFRHVLVRDVAYGQVPRALRAEKHRRAAEWIESLGTDREDRAEMLAHHYVSALEFARAANQDVEPIADRARVALRDAGDRAYGLNALAAAAAFYEEALELSDEEDPEWGRTLARYGRSLFLADWRSNPIELLEEGSKRLIAAGQLEEAAAGEVMLGLIYWYRVERERALEYFEHAAQLIEGLPPSRGKAETLAELARFAMFRDEDVKACELGREALQMAEDLGLEDVRVRTLNTLGTSRVKIGEIEGLADLERSLEISTPGSPERLRAYINLGSISADTGQLTRSRAFHEEGLREAERVGAPGQRRWLLGDLTWDYYMVGRWDEALEGAEGLLASTESERHYIDAVAVLVRGMIRMARGDETGALADSEASLAQARDSSDPQVLWPGLVAHANMLLQVDRRNDATVLVDELLAELAVRTTVFASHWSVPLAVALVALGRADEFHSVAEKAHMATRWRESASAYAAGHFGASAEILAEIGATAEEAFVRLRGAELLVAAARRAEADALLQQALAFYRSVGATAYVAEAERLFAASA
jgi:class 3 adenylate cyclase/tetratricopeptide (TPR) repeat protein